MALSSTDLLSVAGVVVILVGVMVYNALRAAKARPTGAGPAGGSFGGAVTGPDVLQRYVQHGGAIIGQAVAIEDGRVLLRQGLTHRAVSEAKLERAGNELRLVGDIDLVASEAEGAAWAARLPKE
jgi:hypothetical protein